MKKIPKAFIAFLVASTLIWLVLNLSKTYIQSIPFEVDYTNLPQDKIYQKEPVHFIDIHVKATGFKLFAASFSQKILKISISNLKKNKQKYYLLTKGKSLEIQQQLPSGFVFQKVSQDTIHFDLGSLGSKKVPIQPDLSVNYKLGFDATKVEISPDSVLLSGTKLQLKNINSVTLKRLTLENISEDLQKSVAIIYPKNAKKVKMSHRKALISIEVDKFTEGEFEVPVVIKNISQKNITIYPKKVKIIFKVSLDDFNKISADSFEVEADYQYSKDNDLSYLLPKLKIKPEFVSAVRVVPEKIDFLINTDN